MGNLDLRVHDLPKCPERPWVFRREFGDDLTAEALVEYEAQIEAWRRECRENLQQRAIALGGACKLLLDAGFPATRDEWVRGKRKIHLLKNDLAAYVHVSMPSTPSLFEEREWLRTKAATEVIKARERAVEDMSTRAVQWLLGRGKVYGVDFTAATALDLANEIAATEEIARLRSIGGLHEFDGHNCDGPCSGWDGTSKRCDCGNRRVSWVWCDWHTFENPAVRGEAY